MSRGGRRCLPWPGAVISARCAWAGLRVRVIGVLRQGRFAPCLWWSLALPRYECVRSFPFPACGRRRLQGRYGKRRCSIRPFFQRDHSGHGDSFAVTEVLVCAVVEYFPDDGFFSETGLEGVCPHHVREGEVAVAGEHEGVFFHEFS